MPRRIQRLGPSAYFGERTLDYETPDFHLAESTYGASASLPFHAHTNAHLCLVLSGRYRERLERGVVERRPGDLLFYPAAAAHAEDHLRPGRHFLIELGPSLAGRLAVGGRRPGGRLGCARALATRLYGLVRGSEGDGQGLEQLVSRLVETVAVESPPAPAWLRRVERRLRRCLSGPPDLDSLARDVRVHPVYLARAFRRAYGASPGEYLRQLRVGRAQRALAEEGAELADVAYAAGFCDQSHLNRVFKSQTGLTPGRFRALASAS